MFAKILQAIGLLAILGASCAGVCRCAEAMVLHEAERDADWIRGCHVTGYNRERYTTLFVCPDGSTVEMRNGAARGAQEYIRNQQGEP